MTDDYYNIRDCPSGDMISPDVLPLCCRIGTPHPVLRHNHHYYYVLLPANCYKLPISHYSFHNYSISCACDSESDILLLLVIN